MGTVYRITGKDLPAETDFATEDEARTAMREPYLGKNGEWQEDRDTHGYLKVKFVEKTPARGDVKSTTSWTIKRIEAPEESLV